MIKRWGSDNELDTEIKPSQDNYIPTPKGDSNEDDDDTNNINNYSKVLDQVYTNINSGEYNPETSGSEDDDTQQFAKQSYIVTLRLSPESLNSVPSKPSNTMRTRRAQIIESDEEDGSSGPEVEEKQDEDFNGPASDDNSDDEDFGKPRRRKRPSASRKKIPGSEDEFEGNESESSEVSDSDEILSDRSAVDGFIVDSDDNVIRKSSSSGRKRRKNRKQRPSRSTRRRLRSNGGVSDDDDVDDDMAPNGFGSNEEDQEIYDELRELRGEESPPPSRKAPHMLRKRKEINYEILPPPTGFDEPPTTTSTNTRSGAGRARNTGPFRRLFPTTGPFGGHDVFSLYGGGLAGSGPLVPLGGMTNTNNVIGVDSDSSDDEAAAAVAAATGLGGAGQGLTGGVVGGSGNLYGQIKKKPDLADTDPLGIHDVDFDSVGGLDDYIAQLKEMVSLPLKYPEVYARFGITPPRGVLFHGPPGTGKTLMARALAAACSREGGKKVAFFMRKGADCLSKWVGEAERQLRLLFEEARKQQPSIIFFDEIDGLAPVRSSKQEQIHASIVSTLLALMDGMDNRGQVVVIGATNRPDSVDPALRRPGRFDRELYFPLPNVGARRKIIEIHTKKWEEAPSGTFLDELADLTKGYGGADLRALCTEAALSSIIRTYPQIYMTSKKLKIDTNQISVSHEDFLRAMEKITPSSARALTSSSAGVPLPERVEPLLQNLLDELKTKLQRIAPTQQKTKSALEQVLYTQPGGYEVRKRFQTLRIYRPRLLVYGPPGMGQAYLGSALLHQLEGYHVQTIDVGSLFGDPARTPEAAIVHMFAEARRHQPSVIYMPDVPGVIAGLSESSRVSLFGMLRGMDPADRVLVLGLSDEEDVDVVLKQELFGFSTENYGKIHPDLLSPSAIEKFFAPLLEFVVMSPDAIGGDDSQGTRREFPELPEVEEKNEPISTTKTPAELRAIAQEDMRLRNTLKVRLGPLMELIKSRYKRFKKPIIEDHHLVHLFEKRERERELELAKQEEKAINADVTAEADTNGNATAVVEVEAEAGGETTELEQDETVELPNGEAQVNGGVDTSIAAMEIEDSVDVPAYVQAPEPNMILETATGKKYYNMDLDIIEERLWNGFYCEYKQFSRDVSMIHHDAQVSGDRDRMIKAAEMQANVQVTIEDYIRTDPAFNSACKEMHQREKEQTKKTQPDPVEVPNVEVPNGEAKETTTVTTATTTTTNATVEESLSVVEVPVPEESVKAAVVHEPYQLDENLLEIFKQKLVQLVSRKNLTIDQLEQLNAYTVDSVWQNRAEWNRNKVLDSLYSQCKQIVSEMKSNE